MDKLKEGQLVENALVWLKDNYKSFRFFAERDVVWTLQTHMLREAEMQKLPLKIYDNHKLAIFRKQVDLAVLNMDDSADTVIEIKYEPDHHRAGLDISAGKLKPSRVTWASRGFDTPVSDIDRVRRFVAQGVTKSGFCIFIDEGSHFSWKPSPEGSMWVDWGESPYSTARIFVLTTMFS